ncbi:MAG TPA: VWA domain-containing protein [Polyangiaceae bacterium]|nr:VWA domain-containing protein [Polyangiaceae bacterium]
MFLAGLPLTTLLAAFAVAGALVVGLYILKLRRRPVAVPFSRIWQSVLRDKEATQLFSQLKRWLSLLLQLVLLAALVLALGDPRVSAAVVEGRNVVVLVDGSASMKATDVSPTRLAAAKRELSRLVKSLGGSDRMLIAQMDAGLTPLSTMTSDLAELERAVSELRATDTRADLRRGLEFALDSLRDLSRREILVVSDGALGDVQAAGRGLDLRGTRLSFLPVGKSGKNVAITEFSVRRYPLDKSRYEVMLEIMNMNSTPTTVELTLLGDGVVSDITRLSLGANERVLRFYKDLAGASRTLEAKIRPVDRASDELPADNHAYALMPERRRARVAVVTLGNTYLEAALLLDEYLDVSVLAPAQYPARESFDVVIFDGVAPAAQNASGYLYLNPPADKSPVPIGKRIENFGFDAWDKKSDVLRFISMGDIQVAQGQSFKPKLPDRVIGQSDLGPILVDGRRGGVPFVALGFDPRDSDFVLRVGWPLFVLNVVNYFVQEDTGYVSSYRTGEVWRVPAPSNVDVATLVDPAGKSRKVPVKEGRAVYLGEQAGFYRLSTGEREGSSAFAGNLADPEESRIAPRKELVLGSGKAAAVGDFQPGVRRELWLYLLLAVLGVSVIEWITYHRRVTV